MLVIVANVFNIGADLGGMADAMQMITGVPAYYWNPIFAVLIVGLLFWTSYRTMARVFKWLTMVFFASRSFAMSGRSLRAADASKWCERPRHRVPLIVVSPDLGCWLMKVLFQECSRHQRPRSFLRPDGILAKHSSEVKDWAVAQPGNLATQKGERRPCG